MSLKSGLTKFVKDMFYSVTFDGYNVYILLNLYQFLGNNKYYNDDATNLTKKSQIYQILYYKTCF